MSLLESETGKRRLLSVEIPVIERYNEGPRSGLPDSSQQGWRHAGLALCLKPGHNIYQLETRLVSSYPTVPPETRVLTPLKHCPHLLEGQTLVPCGGRAARGPASRWDPAKFHLHLRHPGGLALAGVLRNLARNRRMAVAGSEIDLGDRYRQRCFGVAHCALRTRR